MRSQPARLLVLAAGLAASFACAPALPVTQGPTPQPATPADEATSTPQATLAGGGGEIRSQPMRAGHERDMGAYQDGLRYWLDLRVELDPVSVRGHQRVHYVNASSSDLQEIVFRLVANGLHPRPLHTVTNVTVNGQPAETELSVSNSVLRVKLAEPLPPGESAEVDLDMVLTLPESGEISYGRLADKGSVILLSSFFPMVSVIQNGEWWAEPTVDHGDPAFSESALFDVTLAVPPELGVAASGSLIEQGADESGSAVYRFATGPMRDFSVALGRRFELDTATQDGVTVNVWSSPGDKETDALTLEKSLLALKVFDEQFGEYPFAELDVVEAPIIALGIEYPGLVYIDSDAWIAEEGDLLEFVLSHEIAHQWWYSAVGNDQVGEPWVDEALADYSVIVYFREGHSDAAADEVRNFFQADVTDYVANRGSRMPTGLPASAYGPDEYGTFVYNAGALFYSHLEDDYGQDRVIQMLRAYYTRHRYGVARIEDLRSVTVEFFGDEAGEFFDEWVKGQ